MIGHKWRSPSRAAEDRNDLDRFYGALFGAWRSPSGVTEDRNYVAYQPDAALLLWRSPSKAAEDRNRWLVAAPPRGRHVAVAPPNAVEDRNDEVVTGIRHHLLWQSFFGGPRIAT
ncbi:hypothetical protein [Streptomyces globisporus]|uniref:hypothetical protein n=1 Tax=Streptomyces globisporus TaxID=1908 RepID=UPI00345F255A